MLQNTRKNGNYIASAYTRSSLGLNPMEKAMDTWKAMIQEMQISMAVALSKKKNLKPKLIYFLKRQHKEEEVLTLPIDAQVTLEATMKTQVKEPLNKA